MYRGKARCEFDLTKSLDTQPKAYSCIRNEERRFLRSVYRLLISGSDGAAYVSGDRAYRIYLERGWVQMTELGLG